MPRAARLGITVIPELLSIDAPRPERSCRRRLVVNQQGKQQRARLLLELSRNERGRAFQTLVQPAEILASPPTDALVVEALKQPQGQRRGPDVDLADVEA